MAVSDPKTGKNRIGILTFHNTLNYGASLQCYALQTHLLDAGYDVKVLDYQNEKFKKEYSPFYMPNRSLRKFAYMLAAFPTNVGKRRRKKVFDKKNLMRSAPYDKTDMKDANKNFDCIIVGSDQVWNYNLTNSDFTYLLDFAAPALKKISYAASFGLSSIDEAHARVYLPLLRDFSHLSVREEQGKSLLQNMGVETEAKVVIDPVFLLSREKWLSLLAPPKRKGYIALYMFRNRAALEYAKQLSRSTGKKLVYIGAPIKSFEKCKKVRRIGPFDWLSLIAHADYVVTDSFHGTAFAVLMQKKFVSFRDVDGGMKADSRLETLLGKIGLEHRLLSRQTDVDLIDQEIDQEDVSRRLTALINESKQFLKDALSAE